MNTENNVFNQLNNVDLTDKSKDKNNLKYLSWSSAWSEVKKKYPDATYGIVPQIMDEKGNTRFWHDDGKTGWVEVFVTINGLTHTEVLAIMDFKNISIPADNITSVDANKGMKRCLVKSCAVHGLGLYIYESEDLPENISILIDLQDEVTELARKKSNLSDKTKEKAILLCKEAEKENNPSLDDEFITGKITNITDIEILEKLKKKLLAIRK